MAAASDEPTHDAPALAWPELARIAVVAAAVRPSGCGCGSR